MMKEMIFLVFLNVCCHNLVLCRVDPRLYTKGKFGSFDDDKNVVKENDVASGLYISPMIAPQDSQINASDESNVDKSSASAIDGVANPTTESNTDVGKGTDVVNRDGGKGNDAPIDSVENRTIESNVHVDESTNALINDSMKHFDTVSSKNADRGNGNEIMNLLDSENDKDHPTSTANERFAFYLTDKGITTVDYLKNETSLMDADTKSLISDQPNIFIPFKWINNNDVEARTKNNQPLILPYDTLFDEIFANYFQSESTPVEKSQMVVGLPVYFEFDDNTETIPTKSKSSDEVIYVPKEGNFNYAAKLIISKDADQPFSTPDDHTEDDTLSLSNQTNEYKKGSDWETIYHVSSAEEENELQTTSPALNESSLVGSAEDKSQTLTPILEESDNSTDSYDDENELETQTSSLDESDPIDSGEEISQNEVPARDSSVEITNSSDVNQNVTKQNDVPVRVNVLTIEVTRLDIGYQVFLKKNLHADCNSDVDTQSLYYI